TALAVDGSGNVYAAISFAGTVDFDPGAGTANVTTTGASATAVLKLDSDGNFVYARGFTGAGTINPQDMAVDSAGAVYSALYLEGSGDFHPGAGTANLTSIGTRDIVVSKLDS